MKSSFSSARWDDARRRRTAQTSMCLHRSRKALMVHWGGFYLQPALCCWRFRPHSTDLLIAEPSQTFICKRKRLNTIIFYRFSQITPKVQKHITVSMLFVCIWGTGGLVLLVAFFMISRCVCVCVLPLRLLSVRSWISSRAKRWRFTKTANSSPGTRVNISLVIHQHKLCSLPIYIGHFSLLLWCSKGHFHDSSVICPPVESNPHFNLNM